MKILIVEDNESTIHGLIDAVEDRKWEYNVSNFSEAEKIIIDFDPDIIVMDWMFDAEDAELGKPILENVLSKQFRPTIVFSAHNLEETISEYQKNYPLINFTQKGEDDSELAIIIDTWVNSANAISRLRHNMNSALVESSKALIPFQKMEYFPENRIVSYMMSQRAMQCFEEIDIGCTPPPWIQYIYPPLSKTLLVADIIRFYSPEKDPNSVGTPEEYGVLLTPSCDMANNRSDDFLVLVAKCCGKEKYTEIRLKTSETTDSEKGREKIDRVAKELNYGYNKSFVSLPQLPNVLPLMTIGLKDLVFKTRGEIALSYESFCSEKHSAYRVATINSPFREQIVWAHMINSCRPGVPARDMVEQAKGILS